MIVMGYDLSSSCIGVVFAEVNPKTKKIIYIKTLAIIPKRPDGKDVGYTTKNPKDIAYNGQEFKGFLKPGETAISKTESERRRSQFRSLQHQWLLKNIGKQSGYYLKAVNPHTVILEKNKSYNGVLTTKLLAEIAGGLYFYAGMYEKDLFDYEEATVRARIRKDMPDVDFTDDGVMALDTKWEIRCRLKHYFDKAYPGLLDFQTMTLDETDALAVFYYWYVTAFQEQEG